MHLRVRTDCFAAHSMNDSFLVCIRVWFQNYFLQYCCQSRVSSGWGLPTGQQGRGSPARGHPTTPARSMAGWGVRPGPGYIRPRGHVPWPRPGRDIVSKIESSSGSAGLSPGSGMVAQARTKGLGSSAAAEGRKGEHAHFSPASPSSFPSRSSPAVWMKDADPCCIRAGLVCPLPNPFPGCSWTQAVVLTRAEAQATISCKLT